MSFFLHGCQEVFQLDDFQGGAGGGAAHGVAAKGGDVTQGWVVGKALHDGFIGDKGADGQASAKGFGYGQDIGHDAILLEGEEGACPAHAALDLVEDKQGTGVGAALAQGFHIVARGYADAGIALDGLDDDAGGVFGDFAQLFDLVEMHEVHVGQEGPEHLFLDLVARYAQGAVGTAVVGFIAGYDAGAAGIALGELERALVGLGAGVYKVTAVEVGRQQAGEGLGQAVGCVLDELAEHHDVEMFIQLVFDGLDDVGVAMTEVADANAGDEIGVAFTLGGIEIDAFGPGYGYQIRVRGGLGDFVKKGVVGEVHALKFKVQGSKFKD